MLLEVITIILQRETPQKLIEAHNAEKLRQQNRQTPKNSQNSQNTQESNNNNTSSPAKAQSQQSRGSLGSILDAEKKKRIALQARDVSSTKNRMKGTFALVDQKVVDNFMEYL